MRQGRWYHGWNIVAACVLAQLASLGMPINAFSLFLHDWSVAFKTPVSTLQLAQPAFGLVIAIINPFVGICADKFPARRLFGWAMVGMALFCVAMGSVTATWQIFALYVLLLPLALDFGAAVPANAVISRWFVRRLGFALGLSAFGLGLGGVVLPPLIGALLPVVGWRWLWRLAGLFILVLALPVMLAVFRDRPDPERDDMSYVNTGSAAGAAHGHGGDLTSREIFRRRNFWLLLGAFLPVLSATEGVLLNLAPIVRSHGLGPQAAGGLLAVLSSTHLAATIGLGLVVDKFGNRRPLAALGLIGAAGLAIAALASNFTSLAVAFAVVGLLGGVWTPLGAAISAEFGARNFGRAFGLMTAFSPIGLLAGFAVAKAQEIQGGYGPVLFVLGGGCLIATLLALMIREARPSRSAATPGAPLETTPAA